MLDKNERRRPNYPQISARQAADFETVRQMNYDAHEITRTENYLLPLLIENSFILAHKTNFEKALAEMLRQHRQVNVLDLGCGAGFWLDELAACHSRVSVYGISAADYRHPLDRPPVIFDHFDQSCQSPVYRNPAGNTFYYGNLEKVVTLDDDHYFVGDIHEVLRCLSSNLFHLIVSHQTCRYLFDPLRVLKNDHRVLTPGGYAFMESFEPLVFDMNETLISNTKLQKLFRQTGNSVTYGEYRPYSEGRTRIWLAMKKKGRRFSLPVGYRSIVPTSTSPTYQTDVVTYYLKG